MDDTESKWIQIGNDIVGEGAYDNAGYSVSLSADGNKVAIGSPYYDNISFNTETSPGYVKVYVLQ